MKPTPNRPLRAADDEDGMLEWLRLAASIHVPAVKPYVYATKMQKKLKKTAEEQEKYDALQKNEELKEFHAKHAGGSEFGEQDVATARGILEECFARLEDTLDGPRLDHWAIASPWPIFPGSPCTSCSSDAAIRSKTTRTSRAGRRPSKTGRATGTAS